MKKLLVMVAAVVAGLILAGILAATMSTAESQLLSLGRGEGLPRPPWSPPVFLFNISAGILASFRRFFQIHSEEVIP